MTQNNMPAMAADTVWPSAVPDFDRPVYCILGLPFDRLSLDQATQRLQAAAVAVPPRRCFLSTPNLNFAIACLSDRAFRNSVIQSDLSVADGMPLVLIARILGLPIRERVAGANLFEKLRGNGGNDDIEGAPSAADRAPLRVYFFGGPPGVAEEACAKLNAAPSGMCCVGFESPGFGSIEDMSDAAAIARINRSDADFLVVALGAKKGQAWIQYNLARLRTPLVSHLGAVVNFVAGTVSRAPLWVQRSGLEWFWRIKEEPQLWRRYAGDGLALLHLMVTRVMPCALAIRRRMPPAQRFAAARISWRDNTVGGGAVLALAAAWGESNLPLLRSALRRAATLMQPLEIDLREVDFIDSAALALLMLLYGYRHANGSGLRLTGARPGLVRVFRLHCADYLLAQ
ncbi:MAG: N-acetylglucosaminyldiphospho-UDP N-acetyl-beta-D-mannosaminyltransferase [Herbaspirillum sp.]|nr:N-acetylglucosaminyldiphospho-UDP N-acetyl-beta-D-mannosaminyltransferase [Herbaspirillum sp.]